MIEAGLLNSILQQNSWILWEYIQIYPEQLDILGMISLRAHAVLQSFQGKTFPLSMVNKYL